MSTRVTPGSGALLRPSFNSVYGVYQIEANGRSLFSKIEGDEDTIMGLPVKKIKEYLSTIK